MSMISSAGGEVLPRPKPHVDAHALSRYDERVDTSNGHSRWSFNRATLVGIVMEGPELQQAKKPWWVTALVAGRRYFVDRLPDPTLCVVVAIEGWQVITVLTRAFAEQRQWTR